MYTHLNTTEFYNFTFKRFFFIVSVAHCKFCSFIIANLLAFSYHLNVIPENLSIIITFLKEVSVLSIHMCMLFRVCLDYMMYQ